MNVTTANINARSPEIVMDPKMTGDPHAKAKGWFFYPGCFDPIWKTRLCSNFEPVET